MVIFNFKHITQFSNLKNIGPSFNVRLKVSFSRYELGQFEVVFHFQGLVRLGGLLGNNENTDISASRDWNLD